MKIELSYLTKWFLVHGTRIAVICFLGWLGFRIGSLFIKKFIGAVAKRGYRFKKEGDKDSQNKRIETISRVFISFFRALIWIFIFLTILPEFGINIGPLLAGVGIMGLAIGMGARNLIQDYLAGIMIILEDQYRVGEMVEILNKKGKVLDITLRKTVLEGEKEIYFIPNGQIKTVANLSRKRE